MTFTRATLPVLASVIASCPSGKCSFGGWLSIKTGPTITDELETLPSVAVRRKR